MKKYALVTGGSKGIGRATCLRLADMGYNIIINYHSDNEAAEATRSEVLEKGVDAQIMKFDVGNADEVRTSLERWLKLKDVTIEVLVNNAGLRMDSLMVFTHKDAWLKVIETNLNSFFYLTAILLKNMVLNKYGRIITTSSMSALKGVAGQTHYSASKAALLGASRALAQEVGSKNITVNVVIPGYIRTDMIKELDENEFRNTNALRRFGTPSEVAAVIGFLASADASFITGQAYVVDGGCP